MNGTSVSSADKWVVGEVRRPKSEFRKKPEIRRGLAAVLECSPVGR